MKWRFSSPRRQAVTAYVVVTLWGFGEWKKSAGKAEVWFVQLLDQRSELVGESRGCSLWVTVLLLWTFRFLRQIPGSCAWFETLDWRKARRCNQGYIKARKLLFPTLPGCFGWVVQSDECLYPNYKVPSSTLAEYIANFLTDTPDLDKEM